MKTTSLFEDFGLMISGDGDTNLLELEHGQVLSWFKSAKVLLFRGFAPTVQVFEEFTNQFCPEFLGLQGGITQREAVDAERDKTINYVSTARSSFLRTYPFGIPEKYKSEHSAGYPVPEANLNEAINLPLYAGLPLHGEIYYQKRRPVAIWLYCAIPPVPGEGETLVADGAAIYQALSPRTQELFKQQNVKYITYFPNGKWQKRFFTDDLEKVKQLCLERNVRVKINEADSFVTTESTAPAVFEPPFSQSPVFVNNVLQFLMIEAGVDFDAETEFAGKQVPQDDDLIHTVVRLEDGSKIPDDVVSEIDEVTNQFTRLVTWEKQDILLVDNTRALHGRRAFSCDRAIYIRMGMSIDWEANHVKEKVLH
jgi:alpha-ketoglutarate-dependent taurine dioxygenase